MTELQTTNLQFAWEEPENYQYPNPTINSEIPIAREGKVSNNNIFRSLF